MEASEEVEMVILYDSTYCRDKASRFENQDLTVEYTKHPQKVQLLYVILKGRIEEGWS